MYSLFVNIRNQLYDAGIIKQIHAPFPVMSIGNISVGGTGKTPITLMVARMCTELHIPISLLSSGYKRRGKGIIRLIHDKQLIPSIDPAIVGDEVYLHAESLIYNSVVSCQPKYKALSEFITPILIDDGFQHRKIFRDLDIVLVNREDMDDMVLPFGRLRESCQSLKRAHVIVCTDDMEEQEVRIYMNEHALFVRVTMRLDTPFFLDDELNNDINRNTPIMAVAGIANPKRFLQTLHDNAFNVQHYRWFEDHAEFKDEDTQTICQEAIQYGCSVIAITEKDEVKLRKQQSIFRSQKIRLLVIPIHAEIIEGKQSLQKQLLSICSQYILPE